MKNKYQVKVLLIINSIQVIGIFQSQNLEPPFTGLKSFTLVVRGDGISLTDKKEAFTTQQRGWRRYCLVGG